MLDHHIISWKLQALPPYPTWLTTDTLKHRKMESSTACSQHPLPPPQHHLLPLLRHKHLRMMSAGQIISENPIAPPPPMIYPTITTTTIHPVIVTMMTMTMMIRIQIAIP